MLRHIRVGNTPDYRAIRLASSRCVGTYAYRARVGNRLDLLRRGQHWRSSSIQQHARDPRFRAHYPTQYYDTSVSALRSEMISPQVPLSGNQCALGDNEAGVGALLVVLHHDIVWNVCWCGPATGQGGHEDSVLENERAQLERS